MKGALLTALESRHELGLRALEWKEGMWCALNSFPIPTAEKRGRYRICHAPAPHALWSDFLAALSSGEILVLLPPSSATEEEVLLRQLPADPPLACVLAVFTSGTTGEPKAVLHSAASLEASAQQLLTAFPGHGPTASLLPAWGMAGLIFHCVLPALRSSPFAFSREPFLAWAEQGIEAFSEASIELLSLNPFLLEMLTRAAMPSHWQGLIVSLTAPLKPAIAAAFRARHRQKLLEIYGMSEAAGPVLLQGKSMGASCRLSPEGELEICGNQLMLGYATNGSFTPCNSWLSTGDQFQAEGSRLRFTSRLRELIDLGGRKVAPQLVEEVVETLEEIAECIAIPVELGGVERVGLAYVRAKAATLGKEELASMVEEICRVKLSADLRPRWWGELECVPRLRNGKPNRALIRSGLADLEPSRR